MKLLKFLFFFILISNCSFSQQNIIDNEFMDAALRQVEKEDTMYVQLVEDANRMWLFDDFFKNYYPKLKGKIDSVSLKEMMANSLLIPEGLKFDSVLMKKNKRVRLITAQFANALRGNLEYRDRPYFWKVFYSCTVPIFDNKKQYAIIDFGGGTEWKKMFGMKYLFKKTAQGWRIVERFAAWAS